MTKQSLLLSTMTIAAIGFTSLAHAEVSKTRTVGGVNHSATTTYNRTADTASKSAASTRVTTTANGNTATTNQSIQINADGTYTTSGARTGYNGQTVTTGKTAPLPGQAPAVQAQIQAQPYVATPATAAPAPQQANTTTTAYGPRGWSWNKYRISNKMQNRKGVNE